MNVSGPREISQVGDISRSCVGVCQCGSSVRAVEVSVFVLLRSIRCYVTEVGGP